MVGYKKVGGLHHFRVGRFGGSFYVAKRTLNEVRRANRRREEALVWAGSVAMASLVCVAPFATLVVKLIQIG